jgi:hypothetical protein
MTPDPGTRPRTWTAPAAGVTVLAAPIAFAPSCGGDATRGGGGRGPAPVETRDADGTRRVTRADGTELWRTPDDERGELHHDGAIRGSWTLETGDAPDAVRRFDADTLAALGFTIGSGVPAAPSPRVRSYVEASEPGGRRIVRARAETGPRDVARAEVLFAIAP